LQSLPSQARPSSQELRVKAHGFSLHAAVRWRADQRRELEHLCRYITRPAIANERLKRNRANQVVLQLKSPYKDGTTHIVMEPLEFMERLAALVPRPRLHLIRSTAYWHRTRSCAVKSFPLRQSLPPRPQSEDAHGQGEPARMSWARLLKRVFEGHGGFIAHPPTWHGAHKNFLKNRAVTYQSIIVCIYIARSQIF
jgi:hypothetical protein